MTRPQLSPQLMVSFEIGGTAAKGEGGKKCCIMNLAWYCSYHRVATTGESFKFRSLEGHGPVGYC